MKPLIFPGTVVVAALAMAFAGGCNVSKPAPAPAENPVIRSTPKDVPLEMVEAAEPAKTTVPQDQTAPGMVVHIDPSTGKVLTTPPATGEIPKQAAKAAQAPSPQLYEVPSPTPGGGSMVDLKGQFLTPLVATVGPDGKVKLEHKTVPPQAFEKK